MRWINLIFICTVFVSCLKKETFSTVELLGHAGMGLSQQNAVYVDNSIESIELALSLTGSNGVEIDVQFSKDGTAWLFHDFKLDERTNSSGCIAEKTDEELSKIHYKTLKKEKLIRLSEILPYISESHIIILDLKGYNACTNSYLSNLESIENELVNFKNKCKSTAIFCVTPNYDWMIQFKLTEIPFFFETDELSSALAAIEKQPIEGIVVRNSKFDREEIAQIQATEKKVVIFEVRSPKGIRSALRKLPDYLITDDLRASILEKY